MTKVYNVNGRNLHLNLPGLSLADLIALHNEIDFHASLWADEPDHERVCGACALPIEKGFTHTAGCGSLWPIWPI